MAATNAIPGRERIATAALQEPVHGGTITDGSTTGRATAPRPFHFIAVK